MKVLPKPFKVIIWAQFENSENKKDNRNWNLFFFFWKFVQMKSSRKSLDILFINKLAELFGKELFDSIRPNGVRIFDDIVQSLFFHVQWTKLHNTMDIAKVQNHLR